MIIYWLSWLNWLYPWVKGMHVCSNKGTGRLQRGDNHKNVNMRCRRNFFLKLDYGFLKYKIGSVGREKILKKILRSMARDIYNRDKQLSEVLHNLTTPIVHQFWVSRPIRDLLSPLQLPGNVNSRVFYIGVYWFTAMWYIIIINGRCFWSVFIYYIEVWLHNLPLMLILHWSCKFRS
jgi:hypothetical protein